MRVSCVEIGEPTCVARGSSLSTPLLDVVGAMPKRPVPLVTDVRPSRSSAPRSGLAHAQEMNLGMRGAQFPWGVYACGRWPHSACLARTIHTCLGRYDHGLAVLAVHRPHFVGKWFQVTYEVSGRTDRHSVRMLAQLLSAMFLTTKLAK